MRRATHDGRRAVKQVKISIHALHEESDARAATRSRTVSPFQSTLSMRRATILAGQPCGKTPFISIHALHEESDSTFVYRPPFLTFQSTLSMRRATCPKRDILTAIKFQSTLSMRRATRCVAEIDVGQCISIHALHEESDNMMHLGNAIIVFQSTLSMRRATCANSSMRVCMSFQSTLSMRRATGHVQRIVLGARISIHALHEESDCVSPWLARAQRISIHALHEESDSSQSRRHSMGTDFNPRSP